LTNRRQHQIPQCPVRVGEDFVTPSTAVRDLGIYVDCDASIFIDASQSTYTHVMKTVSNCFAALRQIHSVRHSVTRPVLLSLVKSLVISRLDYGNATLAGLPVYLSNRVQSVLNAAARLVYSARKYDRSFGAAVPRIWNSLPSRVTSSSSLTTFKRQLKTELFTHCFM